MVKLYLAHSSDDKAFVDRVARQLGRFSVVYDQWTFAPGQDLLQAMQNSLDASAGFVLFASRNSLKSVWVNYEIQEAEWRNATDKLQAVVTVIIDDALQVDDLPFWLTHNLFLRSTRPKQVARHLAGEVTRLQDTRHATFFMGREHDLHALAEKLAPVDGIFPRIVVLHGLRGVGRRTLLKRAVSDNLSIRNFVDIELLENEGLTELYVRLFDEAIGFENREAMATAVVEIDQLGPVARAEEVAALLNVMAAANESILLHDHGAFLDEFGQYTEEAIRLMAAIERYDGVYLFIVQRRRPDLVGSSLPLPLTLHQVQPLSLDAAERLLQSYLRAAGISFQPYETRELADYMGGYPPAIDLAVKLIDSYGLQVTLADKTLLVGFLSRTFVDALRKIGIPEHGGVILKTLAALGTLPLNAIASVAGVTEEIAARELRVLMDESLVHPSIGGLYEISAPVVRAIENVFGRPTVDDYEHIGKFLLEQYWALDSLPSLGIIDATLASIARGNSEMLDAFTDIALPSMLERYAKTSYDNQDYASAKSLSLRALNADLSRHQARRILFQSHVREGQWAEAESVLQVIRANNRRDQFYLQGFMLWKQGNLAGAVSAFNDAVRSGDRAASVHRDRAHCLFRLGRIDEAWEAVRQADERFGDNLFVVDLAAQIAIAKREYSYAENYIRRLERLDSAENVAHRKATLMIERGRLPEAMREAERAVNSHNPRFEAQAQLCDIYVRLGDDRAEQAIRELKPGRNANRRDVQVGLEVKRLLRGNRHRLAALEWEKLRSKELPVHKALWATILRQRIDDASIPLSERKQAEEELAQMENIVELPLSVDEASDFDESDYA